ncbi:allophanate hydrolase 2 subunit 2 [Klebsiella pneumoniae]|uniref:Allophanate hydrolase 2 subunit 2 n=1 Tax=Klebsiella pneumoniae TaxID=573 RepID=A0A2X3EM30_KLEPN|nr:allophanate hydrolase 2 subunit 2 [Klebsiella pneumoniae]
MYTSVQDGGREGQRQWGISRCGALDKPAMTIANLLVGNAPEAAALELRWVRSMCSLPATAGSR